MIVNQGATASILPLSQTSRALVGGGGLRNGRNDSVRAVAFISPPSCTFRSNQPCPFINLPTKSRLPTRDFSVYLKNSSCAFPILDLFPTTYSHPQFTTETQITFLQQSSLATRISDLLAKKSLRSVGNHKMASSSPSNAATSDVQASCSNPATSAANPSTSAPKKPLNFS